jgi:molybdopterin-containing oxidoreductase family iron-sulfur binding subunit
MHKLDNGITMHDPQKCIGCRYCQYNCPYGVIYFNWQTPHAYWRDNGSLLNGGTPKPDTLVSDVGGRAIPYYNPEREKTLSGIRPKGVVEKCTFCDHRVKREKLPRCVEACPADARIFGDLDNPKSEVVNLLGKFRPFRLKEELGTRPKVYYIRDFNPADYHYKKGAV